MKQKRKKYTIDFSNVKYYQEMHLVIRDALDFPHYYGCNWSAFWDCLTDMYGEPIRIEIVGLENVRNRFEGFAEKMIEILTRFKHYESTFSDDIQIEIVDGDTRECIN